MLDTDLGQEINTFSGNSESITTLVFSPDGKTLASAGQKIRLWDVDKAEEIIILSGHSEEIFAVSFNPNGSILASAGADGTVKLWDIEDSFAKN